MAAEELIVNHKIRSIKFNPKYMYANAISGDSSPQVNQLAPTIWAAEVTTTTLTPKQYSDWKGWLDIQKNGMRKFKLHDVSREYPLSYLPTPPTLVRAAGGAFNWTCTLASVNSSNRFEVSISGLPAAFVFHSGDYLAFDYLSGARRALHRVSYPGATSNGAGLVTLKVEPHVTPDVTGTPTISLYKAYAVMQIVPDSVDYGEETPEGRGRVIKFQAKQTLKY